MVRHSETQTGICYDEKAAGAQHRKSKYTPWFLRQIQSQLNSNSHKHVYVLQVHVSATIASQICWSINNCQQNSTCKLFHGSFGTHAPPSVVLPWIHIETGEAPTSLLQETLMLYHVIACSPGTSHWKGGTVTLMNRVVITSPFLRLTSFTLDRTENT